jgi:hypothetical protein
VEGELVALDDSVCPEFNWFENWFPAASRIHDYIFELLCCEGRTARNFRWSNVAPWGSPS